MNWGKVLLAGVLAGVVKNLADWLFHGFLLVGTYQSLPEVFTQEPSPTDPLWFFLIAICISITAAILFSKTRNCWGDGAAGGATFGFWLGLVALFSPHYNPLVIEGFPYSLAWYWGIIYVVDAVVAGAVLGIVIKRSGS